MAEKTHCILLIQSNHDPQSRTFSDYETLSECIEGVSKMFEDYLKFKNPLIPVIEYELVELLNFIDSLADISCLVFKKSANMYVPYNKDWIKEKVYVHITKQIPSVDY